MASSSSPAPRPVSSATKYDVFLSFRGGDTRDNFTSHLYEALCSKKIETYIDDRLNKGDEISDSLMKTIEESMIYVIIFSKDYASSPWCLDELLKILECKERYQRLVMPIFYHVDPNVVRHQLKSYADAFVKHENRFKNSMNKVTRWKAALTKAANLSGWDSSKIRSESTLKNQIVDDISRALNHVSFFTSDQFNGLVGVEKHIAAIESLLDMDQYFRDVYYPGKPKPKESEKPKELKKPKEPEKLKKPKKPEEPKKYAEQKKYEEAEKCNRVGIWGIGGIGKTTIAEALFHKYANKFEFGIFIPNVQEEIERHGVSHTLSKYFSKILEGEEPHSAGIHFGSSYMNRRLRRANVLLVLDNVSSSWQIKDLVGWQDRFGARSKIILTSRDMQVLINAEVDEIYEVEIMNFLDALKLFCMNAFNQNHPADDYKELSEKIVDYSGGIPLALKVLGSSLRQKRKAEWESAVGKLQKAPNEEIFHVLKVSYDGLDKEQQDIFLDIACLYRGQDMDSVKQTLDACGFSADIGISNLIDRGLIYILNDKVLMHDLIEQMGQEIVREQSLMKPGKRSRLWKHEDIYVLLRRNTGTAAVQCLYLDLSRIKSIDLDPSTFKMMHNLRMLQFHKSNPTEHSKVYASRGLDYLPDELRFLRWDECPLKVVPLNFSPENLVNLDMPDSNLEKLWDENQHLPNLKRINLHGSRQLTKIPDLSQVPNIEEIILSCCSRLTEVSSSSLLTKLNCLWLDGCITLESVKLISSTLSSSSGFVSLNKCKNLEEFVISKKPVNLSSHVKRTPVRRRENKKEEAKPHERYIPSQNIMEELEFKRYRNSHETHKIKLLRGSCLHQLQI